jgi:transcriptional regulator with XRE-family HTH domain
MDHELATAVGERVRRLRRQAGNSLRRQAELVGVSPSALSALENGRGGMSLTSLQRVGGYFGLTITELLETPSSDDDDGDKPAADVEVFSIAAPGAAVVQRGSGALYQLLGSGIKHDLQPYLISFLPGGGYEIDEMGHQGEEFVYVVVGEIDLLYGDETHRLRQGEAARFRSATPHAFRNASASGIAVILGAATPPW